MADIMTNADLVEYMVKLAAKGGMPDQVLYYSLTKLYEAEMQKSNNLSQQSQAIVQQPVTAEPQASIFSRPEPRVQPQPVVSQTPGDPVINSQQSQRERDAFGRPSQGAEPQAQQPVQPSQPQPVASQVQQPVQPSQPQPVASQTQQPVQPSQPQPVASQAQQPVQPSQPQPVASQAQQPVQPAATGPAANAQALNNIDPNDIRLQRFVDMEPKRLQVLKKNITEEEKRLKLKMDSAPKNRANLYTLITVLAVIGCLKGTLDGGVEAAIMFGLSIAVTTVSVLFFNFFKKKVFDKPKFEKLNFLKSIQDFMNAEDVRKKLENVIESKELIAAEEARRASI